MYYCNQPGPSHFHPSNPVVQQQFPHQSAGGCYFFVDQTSSVVHCCGCLQPVAALVYHPSLGVCRTPVPGFGCCCGGQQYHFAGWGAIRHHFTSAPGGVPGVTAPQQPSFGNAGAALVNPYSYCPFTPRHRIRPRAETGPVCKGGATTSPEDRDVNDEENHNCSENLSSGCATVGKADTDPQTSRSASGLDLELEPVVVTAKSDELKDSTRTENGINTREAASASAVNINIQNQQEGQRKRNEDDTSATTRKGKLHPGNYYYNVEESSKKNTMNRHLQHPTNAGPRRRQQPLQPYRGDENADPRTASEFDPAAHNMQQHAAGTMHSYSLNRTGNAGARVSDRYSSKYVGPNGGHLLHAPTTGAGGPASRSFRLSNSLPNSAEGGLLNVKRNTLKRISPVEDANGESCGRAVTKVKKVQSENQLVAHAVRTLFSGANNGGVVAVDSHERTQPDRAVCGREQPGAAKTGSNSTSASSGSEDPYCAQQAAGWASTQETSSAVAESKQMKTGHADRTLRPSQEQLLQLPSSRTVRVHGTTSTADTDLGPGSRRNSHIETLHAENGTTSQHKQPVEATGKQNSSTTSYVQTGCREDEHLQLDRRMSEVIASSSSSSQRRKVDAIGIAAGGSTSTAPSHPKPANAGQVGEDTSTRIEHQPGDPRLLQQNKDPSKPCASSSCSKINKRRSTRTVVIDTGSAAEYEEQLFTYLRGREKLFRASSNLHFDLGRRARVFDTLVRIHYTCRLREETLFICVNLYDRFLAKAAFKHDHPDYEIQFQLSGLACLLIASKYEDVHPPRCDEILEHIRKIAYKNNPGDPELLRKMSKERLLQMEIDVLNAVGFDINGGSPLEFLNRLMRVTVVQGESTKQRETVSQMAVYLMQLALIDASVSSVHDASAVAGTALLYARKLLKCDMKPRCPPEMKREISSSASVPHWSEEIYKGMRAIWAASAQDNFLYSGLPRKFAGREYGRVSCIQREIVAEEAKQRQLEAHTNNGSDVPAAPVQTKLVSSQSIQRKSVHKSNVGSSGTSTTSDQRISHEQTMGNPTAKAESTRVVNNPTQEVEARVWTTNSAGIIEETSYF
mmetsp:Transcript_3468/g.8154  ORF Transcript_3468/g.8154 Transcript_3468/m.8154 type:complete len:1079 (+) Transcript_3468:623-3859(+)